MVTAKNFLLCFEKGYFFLSNGIDNLYIFVLKIAVEDNFADIMQETCDKCFIWFKKLDSIGNHFSDVTACYGMQPELLSVKKVLAIFFGETFRIRKRSMQYFLPCQIRE